MKRTYLVIALVLVVAGCDATTVDASGTIATEVRDVGSFERIDASQGINVRLLVDPAATSSVTVNYDDNLIDDVTTRVDGSTLKIRLDQSVSFRSNGDRYVEVVVADLTHIAVSNGANLSGSGSLSTVEVDASGGANIALVDLKLEDVDLDASGGANVAMFVTGSVTGSASGGANVAILGNPVSVDVNTSGGAEVNVP